MPRWRNLRNYSVYELSLVLEPDTGRRAAIIKSKPKDQDVQRVAAVDKIIARINKSRLPPMDQMGNPIDDPNELSPEAVKAIQALARQMAMHRDELTLDDLLDIGRKVGLAPGQQDPAGGAPPGGQPGADGNPPVPQPGSDSAADGGQSALSAADDEIDEDEDEWPEQQPPSDEEYEGGQSDGGYDYDDDENELLADEDENEDYDSAAEPEDDDDLNNDANPDDGESPFDNDDVDPEDEPEDAGAPTSPPVENDPKAHEKLGWATPAPPGVEAKAHSAAVTGAKSAYLAALQKKGYSSAKRNAPQGKQPPPKQPAMDKQQPKAPSSGKGKGKNPMGNDIQQLVKKSISQVDWSKFTPEQREQLEPVTKSLGAATREYARVDAENKELVQKHKALCDVVETMRSDAARKELVTKAASFTHLTGHDAIVESAMAIPAGEARDKFMETMKAQNEQIAQIKKSAGGDITEEQGSRNGGEPIIRNGENPETEWDKLISERITKSAENGKVVNEGEAAKLILKTAAGKAAYARYTDWSMRRN